MLAFILELTVIYTAAWLFLWRYMAHITPTLEPARSHLALITILFGVFCAIRLITHLILPRTSYFVNVALLAGFLLLLFAYYIIVLLGLRSWGHVVSAALLITYAPQIGGLLLAMGMDASFLVLLISGLGIGVIWCAAVLLKKINWVARFNQGVGGTIALFTAMLLLAIGSVYFVSFAAAPPVDDAEPVALTLFGSQGATKMQSHAIRASRDLELRNKMARANLSLTQSMSKHNVVLIVVDALRADHLGALGYARPTTPFLSKMTSAGSWETVSGMASVCAESSCGLLGLARSKFVHEQTANDISLYEILRRYGFNVQLILGGDHTNFYGLKEAYGPVDSYFDGSMDKDFYMNDDRLVLNRIAALPEWDGKPIMLQVHLMSCHPLGRREPVVEQFLPSRPYTAAGLPLGRGVNLVEAVNYYDNGVLQADAAVKKIFEMLRDKHYLNDGLIVITGDHGEMLGEHGQFGHANQVFEPVLKVPFLLARFGYSGGPLLARSSPSTVDVAPTILAELGIPVPSSWSGVPLQRPLKRSFLPFQQGKYFGLYDLRKSNHLYKYWLNLTSSEEVAIDLARDPGEIHNLILKAGDDIQKSWRIGVAAAIAAAAP